MPSLLDTFPGIQINATELQQAEVLAEQVLQAKFPDLDLRIGTGIRDLVIRPSATLLAMINKLATYYFAQNTISKVDNTTSTELVDSLMSNWFLYRNLGSKATINVRLFFARNKNVSLTTNTYFSTDGTLKFFPVTSLTIPASSLTLDSYQNEWYYDVELMAESEGTTYNLSSGSLLYFSNFDPYFLHAEINYLSSEAGNVETNLQFLSRGKNAISTRNLINNPSIISNIQANYPSIANVLPIGYGDPEMIRDQISGIVPGVAQPILTHVGGCVDVYCRTNLTTNIIQLTTDALGIVNIPGATIDVTRSSVSGGVLPDSLPLNVTATAVPTTGLTSAGVVATFESTSPHTFSNGDSITISGATPSGYNGTYTITVTDPTHFTYGLAGSLSSPATGTISASKPVPYTVQRNHETAQTIVPVTATASSVTSVGTAATFNTAAPHGFVTGDVISINGATPAGYNGTYSIIVSTANQFTYTLATTLASPATGTIIASKGIVSSGTTVTVWAPYHGFSVDRYVTVDGANQSAYNGSYLISSVSRDSFTYTANSTPSTSPATTGSSLTIKQLSYNYDISYTDKNTTADSTLQVNFTSAYPSMTVSFNCLQFADIDNLQGYVEDPDNRVLSASINARGFNLYYMSFNIVSYNGPSPDVNACTTVINSYLNSLQPGEIFIMADLISSLFAGGITNIQTPLGVTWKKYTRDLILPALTGTITDVFDPYDRTSMFYLEQVTTNNSSA